VSRYFDATRRLKLSICLLLCIIFACVDNVEIKPSQVRLGEHCDYGTITLLFQLDLEGLQVGFMYYNLSKYESKKVRNYERKKDR